MNPRLLAILRCPVTGSPLDLEGETLVSREDGRRYPVRFGIPCLMIPEPSHHGYNVLLEENARQDGEVDVDGFLDGMIVPTCGNLFHGVRLRDRYPVAPLPEDVPHGLVLDVGCNWGRWSIGGARQGRAMVGVDVHLRSLLVAKRLADRLVPDNPPMFVLADARRLPFAPGGFDGVYSYSVVQHFSRENAERILAEAGRVLKRGGCAVIQMPNRDGLKTALTQHRARDRDGEEFEVRYYRIEELLALFQRAIGNARWSVDCFFGLNVHSRDRDLVPASRRWVVDLATLFERLSRRFKPLGRWADSVFVTATKA